MKSLLQTDLVREMLESDDNQFLIHTVTPEGTRLLSRYAGFMTFHYFQERGYFTTKRQAYTVSTLKDELQFLAKYDRLLCEIIDIFRRHGLIQEIQPGTLQTMFLSQQIEDELVNLRKEIYEGKFAQKSYEVYNVYPYVELMNSTIPSLIDVAQGKRSYLNVLFPKGNKAILESIYKSNIQSLFNKLSAHYVTEIISRIAVKSSKVSILEIGAGTGGTTAEVLLALRDHQVNLRYCYTDISSGMVRIGRSKFGQDYNFLDFKVFDVDKAPEVQGFGNQRFDLILCSNVLHATLDINVTIDHVKQLLKDTNGYILINEVVEKLDLNTVTFGLTDGWWKYVDERNRISHSPVLSVAKWTSLLEQQGIEEGISTDAIKELSTIISQCIFIHKS